MLKMIRVGNYTNIPWDTDRYDTAIEVDGPIGADFFSPSDGDMSLPAASEPSDPPDENWVIWMDSTTGDIKIKITHGGVTKSATLADFSSL